MNNNKQFNYTYSAKLQDEVKKIRQKYVPQEEDGIQQLRRLDARVYKKANVKALAVGILGTLIMGTGMSMCLVWGDFLYGIAVGVAGILLSSLAYPTYNRTIKKEREKIAPEIIRISDELLK